MFVHLVRVTYFGRVKGNVEEGGVLLDDHEVDFSRDVTVCVYLRKRSKEHMANGKKIAANKRMEKWSKPFLLLSFYRE